VQLEAGLKTKMPPRMNANEREFHRNHASMKNCRMCNFSKAGFKRLDFRGILLINRRFAMSILDRVSKAVGDVVDRGKKEVDQFVKIQKINSQIDDLENNISKFKGQIQQAKVTIGENAIEMLRAGTLISPELSALLEKINGIQQQISSLEAEITQKKTEIESIRSEDKADKAQSPAAAPAEPQQAAGRFCPQCGVPVQSGEFCAQCGSKLA